MSETDTPPETVQFDSDVDSDEINEELAAKADEFGFDDFEIEDTTTNQYGQYVHVSWLNAAELDEAEVADSGQPDVPEEEEEESESEEDQPEEDEAETESEEDEDEEDEVAAEAEETDLGDIDAADAEEDEEDEGGEEEAPSPPTEFEFDKDAGNKEIKMELADTAAEWDLDGGSVSSMEEQEDGTTVVEVEWEGEPTPPSEQEDEDESEADADEDEDEERDRKEGLSDEAISLGEYGLYLIDNGVTANQTLYYMLCEELGVEPDDLADAKGIQTNTVEKKIRQTEEKLELIES